MAGGELHARPGLGDFLQAHREQAESVGPRAWDPGDHLRRHRLFYRHHVGAGNRNCRPLSAATEGKTARAVSSSVDRSSVIRGVVQWICARRRRRSFVF